MLTFFLLAQVTASGSDAVRIAVDSDQYWVLQDRTLVEAASVLNTGAADAIHTQDFWYARMALRLDGQAGDDVAWRVELEAPTRVRRAIVPWGTAALEEVVVSQVWADVRFDAEWSMRAGIQDVKLSNRPPGIGEPFFLDLGDAESFFPSDPPALPTAVRNTVERVGSRPTGVRVRYDPNPFILAEAFVLGVEEGPGGFSMRHSEYVAGLHATVAIPEDVSLFLLATFHSGPFHGSRLVTVGAGVDAYLDDARTLELFAEVYGQFGSLIDEAGIDVEKEGAFAAAAGARKHLDGWWLEAAYWHLTGDERATDGHDSAFQSYENVDQFLVLEDDELGLDVDTNYRAVKLAAGWGLGPGLLRKDDLHARLDVGWFQLDAPLLGPGGATLTRRDDLGIEVDATVAWQAFDALDFRLRAGWLFSSDVLEAIAPSAKEDTYMVAAGFGLRF